MPKVSAGLLMYRFRRGLEVFLVHPGGPFWTKKDSGAWSIPKGEPEADEDYLEAARREFEEETGIKAPERLLALSPVRQAGGKEIHAWAFEGDTDPGSVKSNTFSMEWPPRSGTCREFPEVDRAGWFVVEEAKGKINKAQVGLVAELSRLLGEGRSS